MKSLHALRGVLVAVLAVLLVTSSAPPALATTAVPRHAAGYAPDRPWPPVPLPDVEESPWGQELASAPFCTGATGPYQRALERHLRLRPVDGKQSAADCRAIQKFQQRHKISPDIGYAGPVTRGMAVLLQARKRPDPKRRCPARAKRVTCVDLSRQLLWVRSRKKVVYGPVPIRSGKRGHRTRGGWHRIGWRHKNHWSTIYHAPMPYSQFFSRGQALHGVYTSLYTGTGSSGCINLRLKDAKALWRRLERGDRLYVFGRKPGT